jgi:hypothetical protein
LAQLIYEQPHARNFTPCHLHRVIDAAIGCDEHFHWRWIQLL